MKKKPHKRPGVIKQHFADFRSRLHEPDKQVNGVQYEVQKHKNAYTVVIHRERGADQKLHFESKQQLDEYLASLG
ncbi:MAG: hypothetical protein AAGM67_00525 [Bacteroidota bacterium]